MSSSSTWCRRAVLHMGASASPTRQGYLDDSPGVKKCLTKRRSAPSSYCPMSPNLSPVDADSGALDGRNDTRWNLRPTQAHSSDLERSPWTLVKRLISRRSRVSSPAPATIESGSEAQLRRGFADSASSLRDASSVALGTFGTVCCTLRAVTVCGAWNRINVGGKAWTTRGG
jgi:hypothetical protein